MPAAKNDTIKGKELYALVQKQQFRCAYSGRELTPETASVDHVEPLTRGGPHDLSNIAIVHMEVNAAKGTMTLGEFVQMCRDVVAWQDGLICHSDDGNGVLLGSLSGKTATGTAGF